MQVLEIRGGKLSKTMAIIIEQGKCYTDINEIMVRHFSKPETCKFCETKFIPELQDLDTHFWELKQTVEVPCPMCKNFNIFSYYKVREDEVQTIRKAQKQAQEQRKRRPWWKELWCS